MTTESPQLQRVREARSGLLRTHPFFGMLSLKLDIEETRLIQTAGVNHKQMVFNPDFVDSMSNAELKGLIAHEVMHLALCHPMRQNKRDKQIWNLACDFAIDPQLKADGFSLPKGEHIHPDFANMNAEQIYEKLMNGATKVKVRAPGQPGGGQGDDDGAGGEGDGEEWGQFEQPGPEGSSENEAAAREWQENAAAALRAAQSAGKVPEQLKREIEAALKPRADWKSILRRFMTDQVKVTSTWSKPNKRFYPGAYLPGKTKTGMGAVCLMIDTSGSIDAHTLAVFEAETNAIIQDCEPAKVYVIYCDAAVNHVDEFDDGEPVKLNPHGGGGTDFRPPFQRVEREGWELACAVYLTDLMGPFPDKPPGFPALWASYGAGGAVAPWGETVAIDG